MNNDYLEWLNEIDCHLFDMLIQNTSKLVKVNYYINGKLHSHVAVLDEVLPFRGIKTSFYYIPFVGEKVALESVELYDTSVEQNDTNKVIFKNQNIAGYDKDSEEEILKAQELLYGEKLVDVVKGYSSTKTNRLTAINTVDDSIVCVDKNLMKYRFDNPFHQDFYEDGMEFYKSIDDDGNVHYILTSSKAPEVDVQEEDDSLDNVVSFLEMKASRGK